MKRAPAPGCASSRPFERRRRRARRRAERPRPRRSRTIDAHRRGPRRHRRGAGARRSRPHPDADKIQLVDVDAGDGEPLQICCGAFNMAVGDLVPLATLGTDDARTAWRSAGARCAASGRTGCCARRRELGLGDDHGGILILAADLAAGHAAARGAGHRADVALRPRDQPEPARRDVDRRRGPRPRRPARRAVHAARRRRVAVGRADRRVVVTVEIVDPDCCGRFTARVLQRRRRSARRPRGSPTG